MLNQLKFYMPSPLHYFVEIYLCPISVLPEIIKNIKILIRMNKKNDDP